MSDVTGLHVFQWAWQGVSGLAEDQFVNSWHFRESGVLGPDYENVEDMLYNFYTGDGQSLAPSVANFMTTENITGDYTLKAYDLTQPKPRTPVYESSGAITPGGADSLPTECSAVMSFQATVESGENQKRRRNRVYLGPFSVQANASGLIKNELVERLLFQGKNLKNESGASTTWEWCIYSPTDDNAEVVWSGWVDNAWDSQRRRGIRKTARGVLNALQPLE